MALTLAQARPLARVVETGMLTSDPRVADRINEAVARLHASGDYLGSVERYGVTVNPATGEFDRPANLQNIMRVAELPAAASHSSGGTLFANDEQAFVFNTSSVLPIQQVSPTRFKVLGRIPAAVDVVGKRTLVPAVSDSDELAITDPHAIKLMLLALWREENNQLDLAQALIAEAQNHLRSKTDLAVAEARRLNFGALATKAGENTFGFARAHIALAVAEGTHLDDHKFAEVINDAEQRLLIQTRLWEARLFRVRGNILAIPYQFESVLKADINNVPKVIQSQWHEYSTDGTGYREDSYAGINIIYRGETPLHTDLPEAGPLSISALGPCNSATLILRGTDPDGVAVEETLVLNDSETVVTTAEFAEVTSVTCEPRESALSIALDTTEVAYLEPWQTESRVARYVIPDGGNCEEQVVRAILRPRWFRKLRDTDPMQIRNLPAITNMVIAVLAERAGDVVKAAAYETRAMGYLETERVSRESGHQRRIETQKRGFMRTKVRALR